MELRNLPPVLYTRKEAGEYLKVSCKTIDRLIRNGRIAAFKIGTKKVLIYANSLTEENINSIRPKFIKK